MDIINNLDIKIKKFVQREAADKSIDYVFEKTSNRIYGDYTTNAALSLAKELKKNPTSIAEGIKNFLLQEDREEIEKIDIVSPGFINIYLSEKYFVMKMINFLNIDQNVVLGERTKLNKFEMIESPGENTNK